MLQWTLQEARMRFFNTEGAVTCTDHCCLPPLKRFEKV